MRIPTLIAVLALGLGACGGAPGAEPEPPPTEPAPAEGPLFIRSPGWQDPEYVNDETRQLYAVADAIEQHRDAIYAQPGVVYLGPSNRYGYASVLVALDSPETFHAFVMPDVGVPFAIEVMEETPCFYKGQLYEHDAVFSSGEPNACPDDCTCRYGSIACTLASCEIAILEIIHFKPGESQVSEPQFSILDPIAQVMKEFPELELTIVGHRTGEETEGLDLERAEAVRARLENSGVAAERLKVDGRGDREPLSLDEPERNRRVVFDVRLPNK